MKKHECQAREATDIHCFTAAVHDCEDHFRKDEQHRSNWIVYIGAIQMFNINPYQHMIICMWTYTCMYVRTLECEDEAFSEARMFERVNDTQMICIWVYKKEICVWLNYLENEYECKRQYCVQTRWTSRVCMYLTLSGSSLRTFQRVNIVGQKYITGVIHVCIHLVGITTIRWKFSFWVHEEDYESQRYVYVVCRYFGNMYV